MRRMVLVAAFLMVLWPVAPAAAQDHYPSPAGTWTVNVDFNFIPDPAHPENTIPFQLANLQDFTSDGRTTNLLPTGPGHPNVGDTRIGCMGEWRIRAGRGPREYDLGMKCKYDQNWDSPYGEIRGMLETEFVGTQQLEVG